MSPTFRHQVNWQKEQKRIEWINNDLCGLGKSILLGSIIINPLVWGLAIYYLHNFKKLKSTNNEQKYKRCKDKSNNLLIATGSIISAYNLVLNGVVAYCFSCYILRIKNNSSSLYIGFIFSAILLLFVLSYGGLRWVINKHHRIELKKLIEEQEQKSSTNKPKISHILLLIYNYGYINAEETQNINEKFIAKTTQEQQISDIYRTLKCKLKSKAKVLRLVCLQTAVSSSGILTFPFPFIPIFGGIIFLYKEMFVNKKTTNNFDDINVSEENEKQLQIDFTENPTAELLREKTYHERWCL